MDDVEDFRALARSSRVLWRSVRFTWRQERGAPWRRGVVRRPGGYRVETLEHRLLGSGQEDPPAIGVGEWVVVDAPSGRRAVPRRSWGGPVPTVIYGQQDDGSPIAPATAAQALTAARSLAPDAPVLRPDGLVARLSDDRWCDSVPFFENYRWVAMLDPIELADGDPYRAAEAAGACPEAGQGPPPGVDVGDLRKVDHHERPALEAVVTTTPAYDPRCGCCTLLNGRVAREIEESAYGGPLPGYEEPGSAPDAQTFRVRLDRGTGICVLAEPLDGSRRWRDDVLVVRIEAVDEAGVGR